ncbi:GAF domain-containing protein [Pseudomonas sp. MWU16-30317]|uniref:GAF domain-containing protein n=1 Tax=Pseudomonas sp. MWU16-30317 TaxID=2878095 RepID=UPI001CFA3AC4|nr:GAF domain-containing protein [Pseudomonas sp. MWU16-30317]
MTSANLIPQIPLSRAERAAIAEIESTTNLLTLVTRLTQMRCAAISKFSETDWIACAVHDEIHFGIQPGDAVALDTTFCNDIRLDPRPLIIPSVSQDKRYSGRPTPQKLGFESYIGLPIFLQNGDVFGTLCVMDSRATLLEDPDLIETLSIFSRLIGCIFSSHRELAES